MHKLATIRMQVRASPARVFDVFEQALMSSVLRGGGMDRDRSGTACAVGEEFRLRSASRGRVVEAHCRVLERDRPRNLAWLIQAPAQSLTVDLGLRDGADAGRPTTVVECQVKLAPTGSLRQAMAHLFGPVIGWGLRRKLEVLRAVAEAEGDPSSVPMAHGGPWRRAQRRYHGLLEACAPGMHEAAAQLLMGNKVPKDVAVLDLGAGTGAWLARLRDAGFGRLAAVELNAEGFGLAGVAPRQLDLNTGFASDFDERFGLITALEIIEHLDSPRAFLRQLRRLLDDGGHALVTMPNVAQWEGRLTFLRRGEHRYFEDGDYEQRHISPVTDLHMRLMFREIGFRLIASTTAGSFSGPLKRWVTAPATFTFRALLGPRALGDVAIYLVARSEPDRTSLGADSEYNRRVAQIWTRQSE